jgi:tRNA threonylcarbamoyladenosine biosynthesis protein TsaB
VLIIGIDTSGKHGGIALARGDGECCEVLDSAPIAGGTFSAQLVPQLAAMLQKHKLDKTGIDGIAAASGPGSFTGLRVGLAAVKGLAEILSKPIAAVSLLEAVAVISGKRNVLAALDAGRGEVYVGHYSVEGSRATLLEPESLVLQSRFTVPAPAVLVTPDSSIAELARSQGAEVHSVQRPGVEIVARIGLRKLLEGDTVSPEQLDANYLRRSDAELFSKIKT